ncbi:hypothetical protein [Aeoliella sp.]|uniref:hypothetical protein n=1 Tax=Aeoliella sp. TaxID=2795800 RepID=UPI003CCC1B8C
MKVTLLIVPPGGGELDYMLDFDLPAIPRVGDYLSIQRAGGSPGFEYFIVRRTWWSLEHPPVDDEQAVSGTPPEIGSVKRIGVECEVAEGAAPTDDHRRSCEIYKAKGLPLREFEDSVY